MKLKQRALTSGSRRHAKETSRVARWVGFALAVFATDSAVGCKKHKPPARSHLWLGPTHACSLQKTGELECWGANGSGQLGDGTLRGRLLPGLVESQPRPDELALGARHTCALSAGTIRCCGDGSRGQLGTGLLTSLRSASSPVIVDGQALTGATTVAAGSERSCALVPGGVRCWGDGVVQATEPEGFHGPATFVAVGYTHVCAAFVSPKAVVCRSEGEPVGAPAATTGVLQGAAVAGLTAGNHHTCALLEDGAIQCWGRNDAGQLGDGTVNDSPIPVLVHGLPPAREVRAGASHTCARLWNNTVACWGANAEHQLANGTTQPGLSPAPVSGLVGAQELSVAGDSACARLADGSVRCWGSNAWGQLGDGTTEAHDVPMPIKAAASAVRP